MANRMMREPSEKRIAWQMTGLRDAANIPID